MEDSWETDDKHLAAADDRWSDEDVDDIKDNWDDEDSDTEKKPEPTAQTDVPKKSTKQRILEKQALKEAEREAKRAELAKLAKEQTPEEKLAEKLRLQKLQEDSELDYLKDFSTEDKKESARESPVVKYDFSSQAGLVSFGKAVIDQVKSTDGLEKSLYYATFLESFVKDLCSDVDADDLKKVISVLNSMHNEKIKATKPTKNKKKDKAKLNAKKEKKSLMEEADDRYIDDLDDFL